MVAYRSFEPFVPLLMSHEKHPVQLWAVWALHHVTTRNSKFGSKNYIKFNILGLFHELISIFHYYKESQIYFLFEKEVF